MNALIAATALFVGGHFLLSGVPLRDTLVQHLGEPLFRLLFSAASIASFVWMIKAYGQTPHDLAIWYPSPALAWVPLLTMPFALILAVAGVTSPSPTSIGPGQPADGRASIGIITITRHPFLWGTALWAGSHIIANGDMASCILMGGILVLSFGGMAHIDQKRAAALGAEWGPIALTTSVLPLHAALTQRTGIANRSGIDWAGIGWLRPIAGLAAYIVIIGGHAHAFGVNALPY